jgi:hypothetical protein
MGKEWDWGWGTGQQSYIYYYCVNAVGMKIKFENYDSTEL